MSSTKETKNKDNNNIIKTLNLCTVGYQLRYEYPPRKAQWEVRLKSLAQPISHGTSNPTAKKHQTKWIYFIILKLWNKKKKESGKGNQMDICEFRRDTSLQLSNVKSVTPCFRKKLVASSSITGRWRLCSCVHPEHLKTNN